ncbi:chemotaxis protein CheW [Occallatibacter riparius]|uniref:Chemotaxis protein CheW n=1 Tax=Occallatibacter riparius TaxID=1002689 RepID=A0A9J7BN01_9BACT|nr:chemotaxis protein CheW [Occallatibacter riparius]UWZ84075.1 chemotaxis protein CheW [Occallatibacter riparius]
MAQQHASKKKTAAEELTQVCSVRLGDTLYGIPIRHILEIVGGARTQQVPLAPEFVGGLLHYRGDVLTTVSLRRVLDMPLNLATQDLLVIEHPAGCFGLLVDRVMEVRTVSSADFEPNPSTVSKQRNGLFAGAYKLDGGLMVMLNPGCLEPMRQAMACE